MRKFLLVILAIFINCVAKSQEVSDTLYVQSEEAPYVFKCNQSEVDMQRCIDIKEEYDGDLKRWATCLKDEFPLDKNNVIHIDYIIVCNKDFPIDEVIETSIQWFNYSFSSAKAVKNAEGNCITACGHYNKIASANVNAIYYIKTSSVSVDADIVIRFKENRIRFEGYIRHYQTILADSALRSENKLIGIESTYPFEKNGDNKNLYSMAFINSTVNLINKANDYVEFLNKNFGQTIETDDNW